VIRLLDWLNARHQNLASARQADLDAWLTGVPRGDRRCAAAFLRWAVKQGLTTLRPPTNSWDGPTGVIDAEQRWQQARWLLHDNTIRPEDRFAGLLVLLYGQYPKSITRLTVDHVGMHGDEVRLRLGGRPIVLPEPLDDLARQLVATRHDQAKLGDLGTSRWLFPGGRPGAPMTADGLGRRLRVLGLQPARAHCAALFTLAGELPAAVLAQMLGFHITCAVGWQRAAAGDWGNYTSDIVQRTSAPAAAADQVQRESQ
jgi:hypothetical protein